MQWYKTPAYNLEVVGLIITFRIMCLFIYLFFFFSNLYIKLMSLINLKK